MHPKKLAYINIINIYIYDIEISHPITVEPHNCKRISLSSYATTIVCGVMG